VGQNFGMIISPVASRLRCLRESPCRAVDCGFGLCGTWGFFFGAAHAPDADRLLAPTSGTGGPPSVGSQINIYKPDTYKGGVGQIRQLEGTRPNGSPLYVESADKFFLGISSVLTSAALLDSLTLSGSTATATTPSDHGLSTGDSVPISGADQDEYNGTFEVTVTGATTFTYEVEGTPASPATGTIFWRAAQDVAFAVIDPHTLDIEYIGGFGSPGNAAGGKAIYISSLDRVWLLASGGIAEIDPADNSYTIHTGLGLITDFVYCPDNDFVYTNSYNTIKRIDPNTLAVTDLTLLTSLTRSGSTATATTPLPHALTTGNSVQISHAVQSEYNGVQTVTVTSPTTFTFSVAGSPATPATDDGDVDGIRWQLPESMTVRSMTWVPDNGVDPQSGKVWISIRDETGAFLPCYLLLVNPSTNAITSTFLGTGSDFFSSLTFIPTIERIIASKPSLGASFWSLQADLTLELVTDRTLTGPGCYVESADKAALPVIKNGTWCIEYYTQEELTP
jgi:hypothetical protein